MVCHRYFKNLILKASNQNIIYRDRNFFVMLDYFKFHLVLQMIQHDREEEEGGQLERPFSFQSREKWMKRGDLPLTSENYFYATRRYVNNWVSKASK